MNYSKEIFVVPVGLNYENAKKFRSKIFINFGEPVPASDYVEKFKNDPVRTINDFTKDFEQHMKKYMLIINNPENDVFADNVTEMFLKDWLLQKRMDCYFGKTLTKRRNAVIHSLAELKTEQQLFDLWRDSNVLRDTFLQLISSRPEGDFKLQFKWLEEVLPGFIYQKNEIENQPELFADFLFWQQNTLKTNGLQDDAFFQTCLLAFSKDSIESFFPAWKFQLSETESASQLGTGQHLKMLQRIDQSHQTGTLFAVLLTTFKEQILADIFEKGVRYWQPKEKILDELGQILAHPPKCLSRLECEALAIRQKMLKDPVGNGIVVNLRSGE